MVVHDHRGSKRLNYGKLHPPLWPLHAYPVDAQFTVAGGQLQRHTAADKTLLANISGSTGEPVANTGTAFLDEVFGNTKGNILYRNASAWQVLAPGSDTNVLTQASGIPSWAAGSGSGITNGGVWSNTAGYSPGTGVTYNGAAYLNYVAVAAAAAGPLPWNSGDMVNGTLSTTNTTNDTFTSTAGGHCCTLGGGKTSGKWYYEFVPSGVLSNNSAVGASTAAFAAFIGGSALGQFLDNFAGGSSGGSWAGLASTKRNAVALDLLHNNFWITADVTASPIIWNGSSLNLPATNTGGYPLGSSPLTQVFQNTYCPTTAGQVVVLYTASASLLIPVVPTGFSIWGAGAAVPNLSPDLDIAHWVAQGNQNPANLNEHALLGGV